MNHSRPIILFSFITIFTVIACKTKREIKASADSNACNEKVTYATLQPLLNKSCNTSGCHDESKKRMNFKIYANLKNFGENGEIKMHVLKEKNMPPQEDLTKEELKRFRCWLEDGMLEK